MSIAIQAVIFFAVYLPGVLCLTAYWGKLSYSQDLPVISSNIPGRAAMAFLLAIVLNMIWGYLYEALVPSHPTWPKIGYDSLLTVFAGPTSNNPKFQSSIDWIATNGTLLVGYFLSLCAFSFLMGLVLHFSVRKMALDMKFRALRFGSDWHYILTSEVIDFSEMEGNKPSGVEHAKGAYCCVSFAMDFDKKIYLYFGAVRSFTLNSTGELDTLTIVTPSRISMEEYDRIPRPDPINIDGYFLVVKYENIKNLVVHYLNEQQFKQLIRGI